MLGYEKEAAEAVAAHAAACGPAPSGQACFPGIGQGRSPRGAAADLRRGWFTTLTPGAPLTERIAAALQALPDQDRTRPDPVFALRAFRKEPRPLP